MPRPLFHSKEQLKIDMPTRTRSAVQTTNKAALNQMLRKPRTKRYMEIIHKLDAGGHVHNQAQVKEILDALKEEFPELEYCGLKGYISICCLGVPYEVHTLDLLGDIIHHYKAGEPLPNGLEKVRSLAMHGGYEVIEVYEDCCRAISPNGSVSVIPL